MKRFTPPWLALASALAGALGADAARPRYGGTLRVETAVSLSAVNPSAVPAAETGEIDRASRDRIRPLVFETLVTPDPAGGLRPVLATAWEADGRATRWRFTIRRGVTLHDGSPLGVRDVAASLGAATHPWRVSSEADAIAIDTDRPMPELPWELAETRHAIRVTRGGATIGTGPFAFDRVESGRWLVLKAHEGHWAGRPFVDAVRIDTGRRLADQLTDLEAGRADLVSLGPQDSRRVRQRGLAVASSMPLELIALVRQPASTRPIDDRARRALSLAIDRRAMTDVLLQGLGEPAAAILPSWLAGDAALSQPASDRAQARSLVSSLPADRRGLTVRFEPSDALVRTLAERIALDAREVGLAITLDPAEPPSLRPIEYRVVRVAFDTTAPDRAASRLRPLLHPQVRRLLPPDPDPGAPLEAVLRFERAALDQHVVIPLVHVPEVYAIGANVDVASGSIVRPSFALDLANVWLRSPAR